MKHIAFAFLLVITSINAIWADELIWPLNCVPQLTSSFGEYRVARFHAGIDFRTPSGEGMPVVALGDGSVVRISNSPWGYGKVLYFRMSNNRIAVFAHLSGFNDRIEQKLFEHQIKERINFAELWFKESELVFRAGDTLGFSGSTGAGSAHLHFELRDGWDKPFDPAIVGYITDDVLPPTLTAIWAVPFGNNASVNGRFKPVRLTPEAGKPIQISASGDIYFAIEAYDLESSINANRYGIGNISLFRGGERIYHFFADTFSFSQNRQAGLIYDLGVQEEFDLRRPPFRLKHPFGTDIGLLKGTFEGAGLIRIDDQPVELRLVLTDTRGNISEQAIVIEPSRKLPIIDLIVEVRENSVEFSINISSDDTTGLVFEFKRDGKLLHERMPFENSPVSVPGHVNYARVRLLDGNNTIAIWRPEPAEVDIITQIHGADNIIIRARFDRPPPALPRLEFRGDLIFPEMDDSVTYSFRLFEYEPNIALMLIVGANKIEYTPDVLLIHDGAKIKLFDDLCELTIPEGGTFFPFLAIAERIPADSIRSELYSIQPFGVVLRSKAELSFSLKPFERNAFNCLIQLWKNDTVFISGNLNKHKIIKGKIGAFGTFGFAIDTIPPSLEFDFTEKASISKVATATISDDLSGFSNSVLPDCYIDDKWTPCEFDIDRKKLLVNVERFENGERLLKIIARDIIGNVVEKEIYFIKN